MTLTALLSRWRSDPETAQNVVESHTLPAQTARSEPFPPDLHPALAEALRELDISRLYLHQLKAWEHANAGENIVVTTGTASGKSLCYNLPVLDGLLRNPAARALYIFPTKALAQDQQAGLQK